MIFKGRVLVCITVTEYLPKIVLTLAKFLIRLKKILNHYISEGLLAILCGLTDQIKPTVVGIRHYNK